MVKKKITQVTKKSATSREVTAEEYNSVVQNAELRTTSLSKSNFAIKPSFFGTKSKHNYSFSDKLSEISFSSDDGVAVAFVDWTIVVKASRTNVFKLDTTFMVLYAGLEGQQQEAVESFLEQTARYTTYPFFRTFVSTISWLSDAELPILPVISAPPKKRNAE